MIGTDRVSTETVQALRQYLLSLPRDTVMCRKAGIVGFVEPLDLDQLGAVLLMLGLPPFD